MITPSRNVRVPDAIWQAAKDRADRDETTVSAVIVAALIAYGTPQPIQLSWLPDEITEKQATS